MLRVDVGEGCSPRPVFVQASRQQKSIPLLRRAGGLVTTASSSMTRAECGGRKAAFDRAKEALREGMDLISCRQKLIKFADRSKAGWAVVDEYVDDDIADDSEDEKHMERAEGMAERKLAKRCKATQETGWGGGGGGGMKRRYPFGGSFETGGSRTTQGPTAFAYLVGSVSTF